ncbi:DNA-binding transcriptional regulator HcaR [Corynebacterium urogenitale]|uniref:DNA-binding transcriptional regulator HcaR n=1 Tax=Corynebacterium urogenitale TaxID=2487892 RepID=A0A5J6Z8X3_9CORY|nr:LysR family transcriptional regulator substrate-binding protein [Corynebacterium urogenitale]QFQ02801.1 DNA-binding transcriptional regulator HcaR [Corynebacterium urogenitale]
MAPQYLRVVFSPGVRPDKWFGRFDTRVPGWRVAGAATDNPLKYVRAGAADVALVRLGQEDVDKNVLHQVHLYDEQVGVAAPKDHPVKVMDAVHYAELEGEMEMYITHEDGEVDIDKLREALGVVAANVGVAIAPRPLLRALNVRGVVHRDLLGETPAGPTRVAVVWKIDRDDDVIQDFVGICRGRKAESSRQQNSRSKRGRAAKNR